MLSGKQILECRSCLELFPSDLREAEKLYLSLMRTYHPDICKDSDSIKISAAVNTLYKRMKNKPSVHYVKICGEMPEISYIRYYSREDGDMYYCGDSVVYVTECDADKSIFRDGDRFHLVAERDVNSEILRNSMNFLPEITEYYKMPDGKTFIRVKLENDEMPLDELLEFYGNDIDSRHCAWITSRLLGLGCFAHSGGNVLNCISTSNFMVSPSRHTLKLSGGWWFMCREGGKMTGVQSDVYENMSISSITDKIAVYATDIECIKAVCRRIFPENSPKAMLDFAEGISENDIFTEFENWDNTLYKAFGGRFFTEMKLCAADIYN